MNPTHALTNDSVHDRLNIAYKTMDELSTVIEYDAYKLRASNIAILIDALHHDYANHMQMEVDGS